MNPEERAFLAGVRPAVGPRDDNTDGECESVKQDELARRRKAKAQDNNDAGKHAETWPLPLNLFRGLTPPPLTATDVPRIIGECADLFARAGGFDVTGAIVAGVVTCAAAIDDGIRLLLPGASGHFESARVWAAAIGSPGTGKSPMQRVMLSPLHAIHRDLVAANERDRKAAKDAANDERTPQHAALTSDCTIDKLSELLTDNPRGLLYCVDEFDSWLGQHEAFGRDGGARNRGEWLRLYDGGPHQVDRVRRGSFYIKNWGASVLTATTPAALARLARKLTADGLFQRFMAFAVRPMQERERTVAALVVRHAHDAYGARIRALYTQSAELVERPIVHLSADAAALYEAEERRLRTLTEAAEAVGESFAAHVAKHAGMLARVALTFHAAGDELSTNGEAMRHPCTANLSAATMQLAIRFMRRAYQHGFAVYTQCLCAGSPMELAKALARSTLADNLPSFNRREITHRCNAFRGATEWQRTAALTALQDYGWIELDTILPDAHGARWSINPRVHELFAAEAEAARNRRQQVREAVTGHAQ